MTDIGSQTPELIQSQGFGPTSDLNKSLENFYSKRVKVDLDELIVTGCLDVKKMYEVHQGGTSLLSYVEETSI